MRTASHATRVPARCASRLFAALLFTALLTGVPAMPGGPRPLPGQTVEELDLDDPPLQSPSSPPESPADVAAAARKMRKQTNEFRQGNALSVLEPDEQLNATAQDFADFMARTGKYGHTANDQRPSERAKEHGYEYCIVAENIAYQFRSTGFTAEELADRFVTGWKNSPEHRKNMLDPDVTEIGLAVARQEDSPTYFAVQLFGRPKSKSIMFRVTNHVDETVKYAVRRRNDDDKMFPLPTRATRTHQRCRPTTISLEDSSKTLKVEDGTEYEVVRSDQGALKLRRRK